MQKIMGDRRRPEDKKDPYGVEDARAQLRTSYRMIEQQMSDGGWAMGGEFGLPDCAALPALFYGNMAEPFARNNKNGRAYLGSPKAWASATRRVKDAAPPFTMGRKLAVKFSAVVSVARAPA